ncbi:uncharacterized protein LOC132193464 [Neocloeon triangulifer]|uniref:uncharacterized protein LOC132193464 n=1 Tax=Neocloeon triangulifer TaxID=2078957 RepID=UPI00286F082A|nr:uncharacterized protein LOC132193464 [Neocloeon triangulifer]
MLSSDTMARLVVFLQLALLGAFVAAQDPALPRLIDRFQVKHPAFVQLYATEANVDPLDKYTLFVSTFDAIAIPSAYDEVYMLRSPGRQLNNVANWNLTLIDKANIWPNDPNYMPSDVVGREGVIWTSGFLVPGKQRGALNVYLTDVDPAEGPWNIAGLEPDTFSYHRVIWYDVNHDGFKDALTARFSLRTFGSDVLQLLWLENPGTGEPSANWTQRIIFEGGPDVHFRITTMQANGQDFTVLVASEFFTEKLSIYYAADGSDSFLSDPSTLIQRVIDNVNIGQTFDLDVGDLNNDGRRELIVCGYNYSFGGNVFVFPIPDDFRTDEWQRITIASGFMPAPGPNLMSPGAPQPFYRGVDHQLSGDKPYLFVSGDDDGRHYILEPVSQDPAVWDYTKHLLIDTNGTTTGKYSIHDIDNDGFNEIVAAAYSAGEVYVFTYGP